MNFAGITINGMPFDYMLSDAALLAAVGNHTLVEYTIDTDGQSVTLEWSRTPKINAWILYSEAAPPEVELPFDIRGELGHLNPDANVVFDTNDGTYTIGGVPQAGMGTPLSMEWNEGGLETMVFDFDSITLGPGVTITAVGPRPLTLLSVGEVAIHGVIDLSGSPGGSATTGVEDGGGGGGGGGGAGGAVAILTDGSQLEITGVILANGAPGGPAGAPGTAVSSGTGEGGLAGIDGPGGSPGGAGGSGGTNLFPGGAGGNGGAGGTCGVVEAPPTCWDETQCHGDTDATGDVKGSDFLALKNSWYKVYGDDAYDPCADFDRNGEVKGSDFLILKDNWYQTVAADCPVGGVWPP
jgi:hypothetical protein